MKKYTRFIGIDVASATFTASIFEASDRAVQSHEPFPNNRSGFMALEKWIGQTDKLKEESLLCLEATGVYGEALCYHLAARGFAVALESPDKVKRAFKVKGHKTDAVDAAQIAQYAFRFSDQLRLWKPKPEIIEQLRVLLSIREQFIEQKTANSNALKTVKRKVVQTPLANRLYLTNIKRLVEQIATIEEEICQLIDKDQDFKNTVQLLMSIPGIGLLFSANFLVITDGFQQNLEYKKLAALIGICPYEHSSGSSIHKTPRSSGMGPPRMRKLLHLAARSVKEHQPKFQVYFARKLNEGKPKLLILNNIANKLLKIACAVVRENQVYLKNHIPNNPNPLKCA